MTAPSTRASAGADGQGPALPQAALDLLGRPPEEAARLLALQHLCAVRAASRCSPTDEEALHVLGGALGRLQAVLQAFQPALRSSVGARPLRGLDSLRRACGRSRDLALLRRSLEPGPVRGDPDAGVKWLQRGLVSLERRARGRLGAWLSRSLPALAADLEERLSAYVLERRVGEPVPTFAEALERQVRGERQRLVEHLAELGSHERLYPDFQAHRAAQTLRALLEGARPAPPELGAALEEALEELGALEGALGGLRDLQLRAAWLAHALGGPPPSRGAQASDEAPAWPWPSGSVAPGPKARAGLRALALETRRQAKAGLRRLRLDWLRGRAAGVQRTLAALEASMVRAQEALPLEIERKYLLRKVPPRALRVKPSELSQGWLPGKKLQERLRRVVRPDGRVELLRTVKLGRGLSRVEVEEPASPELFRALWRLTKGRRVVKRRYAVKEGPRVWEVDDFSDRDLVLAEVELPTAKAEAPLPGWLRPFVVCEVTLEGAFVNVNLAR